MNIHKNARLTLIRRREMVLSVIERGLSYAAAGAVFGVAKTCGGKWVRRYKAEGESGLHDRSSPPHRSPTAIVKELVSRSTGFWG